MEEARAQRQELLLYVRYLQLLGMILPEDVGPEAWETSNNVASELKMASLSRIHGIYPGLRDSLRANVQNSLKVIEPKRPWLQIATEFNAKWENESVLLDGLEFGWLSKCFDAAKIGIRPDLPWHARIGVGYNAGSISLNEDTLLKDAFFTLALAHDAFDRLVKRATSANLVRPRSDKELLNLLKFNISAYSRLAVVGFFAFLEAFVNGLAFDYLGKNPAKVAAHDRGILLGRKDGRFISLEQKLLLFPSVIRGTGKRNGANGYDLASLKALRDSTMHHSPAKVRIWYGPADWVKRADEAAEKVLSVAAKFWQSCYPGEPRPWYLLRLDFAVQWELAQQRLRAGKK